MLSFKEFWTKKTLLGLGLGQFLSLLITSTGFSSSELARKGINAPTSQSFFNYVLLAIVYGSLMLYRRQPLKAKWYYYLILGLIDVEGNFLVVKAYQYTSLTSVMLLDCWTIPCVMFLTWIFLKTKYRYKKITGVVVCVAGLVTVIFSDVHAGDRGSGSNPRKGDALVIAGATLYAVSNVSEHNAHGNCSYIDSYFVLSIAFIKTAYSLLLLEFLVKKADRIELMAFLGLFGGIISAVQISILERKELQSIHWSAGAALPFFGYALAMFLFYSFVPILLKTNGATMLNLSLLTSDMWAVLIRIGAYHEKVDWLYFIAFAAVAVGLIIYSGGDKDDDQPCAEIVDEEALGNKDFEDEASCSQRTAGGSSKTRDASKHKSAASGIGENLLLENKNEGYDDALGKKS
ncbi:solute carrier family 35 protein [Citrus sinensis]|nr:solute carrier family 35 protein [Citrus sinensis]